MRRPSLTFALFAAFVVHVSLNRNTGPNPPQSQGHRLFQTGKRGCHGLGVFDKAVPLYIRTAIPKTG
jgi:hypothetical protein